MDMAKIKHELVKATKKQIEALRKLVLKGAKIKEQDNVKLGNMGSWAELPGGCDWFIPELNITVKGTCGEFCKGCFNKENPKCSACYVFKSYVKNTFRNEDGTVGDIQKNRCYVKLGHAYRTIAMTAFRDELLLSLDKQLTRKKKKFEIVRINESGEFTCYEDLAMWCELSRRHPETIFYVYTKNYAAVRKALINNIVPSNFFINISIWHQLGIKDYMEMKDHPQIRAFVLVDKEWTRKRYAMEGLEITSMCGAYKENGKLNHNVTCDKCKKCFGRTSKCTGCNEH